MRISKREPAAPSSARHGEPANAVMKAPEDYFKTFAGIIGAEGYIPRHVSHYDEPVLVGKMPRMTFKTAEKMLGHKLDYN